MFNIEYRSAAAAAATAFAQLVAANLPLDQRTDWLEYVLIINTHTTESREQNRLLFACSCHLRSNLLTAAAAEQTFDPAVAAAAAAQQCHDGCPLPVTGLAGQWLRNLRSALGSLAN